MHRKDFAVLDSKDKSWRDQLMHHRNCCISKKPEKKFSGFFYYICNMESKSNLVMPIVMGVSSYYIASNIMLTGKNGVYNHMNKLYMGLLMVDIMFLMDGLMKKNVNSIGLSLVAGAILTSLIRNQSFVSDKEFTKGMIEHHDMALFMASRVKEKTDNPEVKKLSENILENQQKEIDLMKSWLK